MLIQCVGRERERENKYISTWNVSYCRLGNCCNHPSSFQVKCKCGGCSAHSYWLFFPGEESSSSNRMGLPTGLLSCHCSPFHTTHLQPLSFFFLSVCNSPFLLYFFFPPLLVIRSHAGYCSFQSSFQSSFCPDYVFPLKSFNLGVLQR